MRFRRKNLLGGRYQLGAELGAGSMGTVFKAVDTRTGRTVAVKILHRYLRRDPQFTARFQREAQLSLTLDSRHVIQALGSGQDNGADFLAMEYVEGVTLSELLRSQGPLGEVDACRVAVQIARALEEADGKGVTHRDIKPDNVIVQANGNVKVADFGIARAENLDSLGTTDALGSVQYMAPERFAPSRFGPADSRSDIYALGAVFYEMLTGLPPFGDVSGGEVIRMHLEDEPQSLRLLVPEVSPEVAQLIERCVRKQPGDRWQSASELRAELERLLPEIQQVEVLQIPLVTASLQRSNVPLFAVAGLAAIGVAIAVSATVVLGGGSPGKEAPAEAAVPSPTAPTLAEIGDATPSSTTPPGPTSTPTSQPNRRDCAAIRGTSYLSITERDWFLSNCLESGPTNTQILVTPSLTPILPTATPSKVTLPGLPTLTLAFQARQEIGSLEGLPAGAQSFRPYRFLVGGFDLLSVHIDDLHVEVHPAFPGRTPNDPPRSVRAGNLFYIDVPPDVPPGMYTVTLTVPDGRTAIAEFEHIP